MKNIIILIILITLTSCSQKWYAKKCNKRFPVIENTKEIIKQIEGKTDTLYIEPMEVNCDSIVRDEIERAKVSNIQYVPKLIKVPCPPSTHRVDTIQNTITITKKDSAGNFLLQSELSHLRFKTQTQSEKIIEQAKTIRKFYFWGLSTILLIAGLIFLKFYFKIKI